METRISESDLNFRSLCCRQNRHHDTLTRFVNGDVSLSQRLIRSIRKSRPVRSEAGWLVQEYGALVATRNRYHLGVENLEIQPYVGNNPHVRRLQILLAGLDEQDILGAYVHGSVGSYEEIPYSDLDTLVILGDQVFADQRKLTWIANQLNRWKKHLFAHDPLQHHGWFLLTSFDLECYCEAYFPVALFNHAKSLFEERGCRLTIRHREANRELCAAFEEMAQSVESQLRSKRYPDNMYRLKSFLSRVMLLPALYVQARDGNGVWKADSFDMASTDFDPVVWKPMDQVSLIRQEWIYNTGVVSRLILRDTGLASALYRKYVNSPIPDRIDSLCTEELYAGIAELVSAMRLRLEFVLSGNSQLGFYVDTGKAP